MDGLKLAFGGRGMTVEAGRQCEKDRKEWSKVYISTGIPTRVVGTCFCGGNLGSAGNLSICLDFKVFSFVMTCNNKDGAIFGCHITFCAITQYL